MQFLSVAVITYNEAHNIKRCLKSVKQIADEIIVLDAFSTDNTCEIARRMGAIVKQQKFKNYIDQKNRALTFTSHNYVLCLDADEELDEQLVESILEIKNNLTAHGYLCSRCTNYCGKFIKHGSWYPDKKIRLFDQRAARWGGINPHD